MSKYVRFSGEESAESIVEKQNNIIKEQDDKLKQLSKTIGNLNTVGRDINTSLKQQNEVIINIGDNMAKTKPKIQQSTKDVKKLVKDNSYPEEWKRTCYTVIGVLVSVGLAAGCISYYYV